jgi:hypothetical protein
LPLDVKPFAQQREYGCLPACLQTVRFYYKEKLTDEDASELCAEYDAAISPEGGCEWDTAVNNLAGTYSSIDAVATPDDGLDEAWDKLRDCVENGKHPVIVHLRWKGLSGGKHAVVVFGVHDAHVDIMNPYFDYMDFGVDQDGKLEDMGRDEFLSRWNALGFDSIYFSE